MKRVILTHAQLDDVWTIIIIQAEKSEMKGDEEMSPNEKDGEKRMPRNSLITPSLHLCLMFVCVNILLGINFARNAS